MKGKKLLGVVLLILTIIIIQSTKASADTYQCNNCSSCNSSLATASSGDIVYLNESILTEVNCIDTFQDNTTFDCQGNTIGGNATAAYGIHIISKNNVTINNCIVSGFDLYNLYLSAVQNSNFENITTEKSDGGWHSLFLQSSSNNIFRNISSVDNIAQDGIHIKSSSSNNKFYNVTATNNSMMGIYMDSSSNNNIFNSIISAENGLNGIDSDGCQGNVFINVLSKNNSGGVIAANSQNFTFSNVTATNNTIGIYTRASSNLTFSNVTATNNYYAIEMLGASSNLTFSNVTATNNTIGIYMNSTSNIAFYNVTANNNTNYGIYIRNSLNNSFSNVTTINNNFAIYMNSTSNITFYSVISNNNAYGVYIRNSSNIFFDGISTNNNINYGIFIINSSNNFFNGISITNNTVGLWVYANSNSNQFSNATFLNNTDAGIIITNSDYNVFSNIITSSIYDSSNDGTFIFNNAKHINVTNITISNSVNGVNFYANSSNNTIKDSKIENCTGFTLNFSGQSASENLIYNNIINSSGSNYGIKIASGAYNFWNVSSNCSKTNIIGSYCVGGNYYTNSTGGFSDGLNCGNNNNDSFCDDALVFDINNTDYLPLTTVPPRWSNNHTKIVQNYSNFNASQFNITWFDNLSGIYSGIDTVLIEGNWSGAPTNYTMTHLGNGVYNFSAILPAGTFYWMSCGNNTQGRLNCTGKWVFTVSKASSTTSMEMNGTLNSDRSYAQGETWNITGLAMDDLINVTIYINGTLSGSGLGRAENISSFTAIGSYNVTIYSQENSNYTGSSRLQYLIITSAGTPTFSDIKEQYPSPTYNYSRNSQQFNITWAWNSSSANLSAVMLEFDGMNYTATSNRSISESSAEFYYTVNNTLAAGTYIYKWYCNDTLGNMGETLNQMYAMGKANPSSSMTLSSNEGWSVYEGTVIILSGSETNSGDSGCSYKLYLNGGEKTNPYTQILPTGIYILNYSTSGCSNYTSDEIMHDFTVLNKPSSGGGNEETVVEYVSGNWTTTTPAFTLLMSPGSSIRQEIIIDNRQNVNLEKLALECVPPSCVKQGCFNLCPYVTFEDYNNSKSSLSIPPGEQGKVAYFLDFRDSFIKPRNLTSVPPGSYSFIIKVRIGKTSIPIPVDVMVFQGVEHFGDAITWVSGATTLNLWGIELAIPNWLIAVALVIGIVICTALILSFMFGKPKRKMIKFGKRRRF